MKKTNKMMRTVLAVLILGGSLFLSSCQKDKNPATPGNPSTTTDFTSARLSNDPLIYPAQSHANGKSLAEWGIALFEWQFKFDTDHAPYLDTDGSLQNQDQS